MAKDEKPGRPQYHVLSTKTIWLGSLIMITIAVCSIWLLLMFFGGDTKDSNRLEIIKTAGTLVVGTGGAVALLLAARRQRFVELDGTERRITELQTKAADQLGSEQATVRLAGLYALERLAQDNPSHRQTIVDIICGYLRMPYTPPPQHSVALRNAASLRPRRPAWMRPRSTNSNAITGKGPWQEWQVRLTAQRILTAHLQPVPTRRRGKPRNPKYWPHIDLDLRGATLTDFDLQSCRVRSGNFMGATFAGGASFNETTLAGNVSFSKANFKGNTWFDRATFTQDASFNEATFTSNASFDEAIFTGKTSFDKATFTESVGFIGATFTKDASFDNATFNKHVGFGRATFTRHASFSSATFTGNARFDQATFTRRVSFSSATFTGYARFVGTKFIRDASFSMATFTRNAWFVEATFIRDAFFSGATFAGKTWFNKAVFARYTSFNDATLHDEFNFNEARIYWEPGSAASKCVWPQGWARGAPANIRDIPKKARRAVADRTWHLLERRQEP